MRLGRLFKFREMGRICGNMSKWEGTNNNSAWLMVHTIIHMYTVHFSTKCDAHCMYGLCIILCKMYNVRFIRP